MRLWRGFIHESKVFCDYARKSPAGKLRWWLACLFSAGPMYHWFVFSDWLRRWVKR